MIDTRETRAELRARLDRTFCEQLADLAHAIGSVDDETLAWVADKVNELADMARAMDARSPEEFDDRFPVMRDLIGR